MGNTKQEQWIKRNSIFDTQVCMDTISIFMLDGFIQENKQKNN